MLVAEGEAAPWTLFPPFPGEWATCLLCGSHSMSPLSPLKAYQCFSSYSEQTFQRGMTQAEIQAAET